MLLDQLSELSTIVIFTLAGAHFLMFLILRIWVNRDIQELASVLEDFTNGISHRSRMDSSEHVADQIDAFLADVKDILDNPDRTADRLILADRMRIIDEKRRYLSSMSFMTMYNMARTMIEAYPLAGVLGTILAIGAALQFQSTGQEVTVNVIVARFGDAIWSTFAGLIVAISLMFINSLFEPTVIRLMEIRQQVREMISRIKRELVFTTSDAAMQALMNSSEGIVPPEEGRSL
jgi:biopolymer transport protein ExbB/TolQ